MTNDPDRLRTAGSVMRAIPILMLVLIATAARADRITDPEVLRQLNSPPPPSHGPWEKQPIIIRYKDKKTCQDAAVQVKLAGDAYVDSNGRTIPIPPVIAVRTVLTDSVSHHSQRLQRVRTVSGNEQINLVCVK